MEFLFKDTSFKFETLRAAGFAVDNGADLSEVLLTAAAIPEGDEEAWMREWKATADRIYERGKYSLGMETRSVRGRHSCARRPTIVAPSSIGEGPSTTRMSSNCLAFLAKHS